MKTELLLETERALPSEFRSAGDTMLFESPTNLRPRIFGVEQGGASRAAWRRGNFFQPQDDLMEDLEWRMGL